ncbi:hypothetical protein ABZ546_14250 [Brachybacterium paraconglomeratum]
MTGQLLPFPTGRRRPRATVTKAGFRDDDVRYIVGCSCGFSRVEHVKTEASRVKRVHDAEHRRAEAAHPAGKALPAGGEGA